MKTSGRPILLLLLVCMFALGALQPLAAEMEPGWSVGISFISPVGGLGYMGEFGLFSDRFSIALGAQALVYLPNELYLRLVLNVDSISFFAATSLFFTPSFVTSSFHSETKEVISSYINTEGVFFSTGLTFMGGIGFGDSASTMVFLGGGVVHDFEFGLWQPAFSVAKLITGSRR